MLNLNLQELRKWRTYLSAAALLSAGVCAKIFSGLALVGGSPGQYFFVAVGVDKILYGTPIAVFGGSLGALIALQLAWTQIDDSDAAVKKAEADARDARTRSRQAYDEYESLRRDLAHQQERANERQAELQKQWLELGEAQKAHEGRARHLAKQIADQQRKNEKPRRNDRSGGGSQNSNPNPKPF
jgi:hypothetical protein